MTGSDHSPHQVLELQRASNMNPGSRSHDITVVIADLTGGGAQRVLKNLIESWSEQELRICLITFSSEYPDSYALPVDITRLSVRSLLQSGMMHVVPAMSQEPILRRLKEYISWGRGIVRVIIGLDQIRALNRLLRMANSPVVLSFMTGSNVKVVLASIGLDTRVVLSERNDLTKQPPNWPWHVLRRWLYRYADAVTANSREAVASMKSFVPSTKLFFVPNPVNMPCLSACEMRRNKVILNVGRLTAQKAQDVLLNAYAQVVVREPEWNLVIAGRGVDKEKLQEQALALNLMDRIDWVDWTPKIESYYQRAGIFVLPSRFEGTPNALLEAMSFGLPSIVSDGSPGPLEHIVDGENGLVVPVEDEKRLAEAILRLIESEELRNRLGAAARLTMEEFSQDAVHGEWMRVLGLPDRKQASMT